MEKDKKKNRFVIPKRKAAAVILAASEVISVAGSQPKTVASISPSEPDYSNIHWEVLVPSSIAPEDPRIAIHERILQNRDNSPGETQVNSPSPFPRRSIESFQQNQDSKTQNEILLEKYQTQKSQVLDIIKQNPGVFGDRDINDINMYFPIYKAVADKFNIDWYLIWINHEGETGASKSTIAFDGQTYPYFGGWQRNVNTWTQDFVDRAFQGLEYLNSVKTRNNTDAKEAAAMAAEMAPNIERYSYLGPRGAVFNAFKIFTGDIKGTGLALERTNLWQDYSQIFGSIL